MAQGLRAQGSRGRHLPATQHLPASGLKPGSSASSWRPGLLCASEGLRGSPSPSLLSPLTPATPNAWGALPSPPVQFCPCGLLPDHRGDPEPKERLSVI